MRPNSASEPGESGRRAVMIPAVAIRQGQPHRKLGISGERPPDRSVRLDHSGDDRQAEPGANGLAGPVTYRRGRTARKPRTGSAAGIPGPLSITACTTRRSVLARRHDRAGTACSGRWPAGWSHCATVPHHPMTTGSGRPNGDLGPVNMSVATASTASRDMPTGPRSSGRP